MVRILNIHFFFWGFVCLLLQSHRLFVCLKMSAFSFFLWVSRGQRLTWCRHAPLEIPKSPRATRPPTQWGRFVCESGRTMACWVCPLPAGAGSFVRVEGQWPFGCAPLPNGAGSFVRVDGQWPFRCTPLPNGVGSFVRVEGQWPFGCAPLLDGTLDRRMGLSTSKCTKDLHAVEPGSGTSHRRPAPAPIAIEPTPKDQDTHKQGPDTRWEH